MLWERRGSVERDQLPHEVSHSTVTNQSREKQLSAPSRTAQPGWDLPALLLPLVTQRVEIARDGVHPCVGRRKVDHGVWLLLEPVLQHHHRNTCLP